ncbi:MAG: aminotransferase class I/II-fold pyridoxal phosphate-dependent enzyme [Bowdeniella nasicola]|nr:aminotransferase class I/II-fold pyridoxal phosphate-dependent enzyme [Bowdeniella nasicola]
MGGAFDTPIDRWGTWSAKWDLLAAPLGADALSLSVADQEFTSCPAVRDAVERAAGHGLYGYTEVFADYAAAAASWQCTRHGWDVDEGEIVFFPRIVQLISALVNHVFAEPPTVATLMPAYGPILEVVRAAGCELIEVPLTETRQGWRLPDERLGAAIEAADVFLLCSPHNPTGRVWEPAELDRIAEAAMTGHTLVISDDIHADFLRPEATYVPLAKRAPELARAGLLVTCLSPGKTFNTAGLEAAAIIVPDPQLRADLTAAKRRIGLHNPNYFAIPATIAAWTRGHAWVDELNAVIDHNLAILASFLTTELPQARFHAPEGTYLLWADLAAYVSDAHALQAWQERARVALAAGSDFGADYPTWARFNAALPASTLEVALSRLVNAM